MSTRPISSRPLPEPSHSPWHLTPKVLHRMPMSDDKKFRKWELLPADPETAFVTKCFTQSKPPGYAIAKIYCIHNALLLQNFEADLIHIEQESQASPVETQMGNERWQKQTLPYTPLEVSVEGKKISLKSAKIVPVWYESHPTRSETICTSGFTYLGRPSICDAQGDETLERNLGSGVYFSCSAQDATSGCLLLSWIAMSEPYFVEKDLSAQELKGKGAYRDYNAHYILHSSNRPIDDEIVVFRPSQALVRFWVELASDTPAPLIKHTYSFAAAYRACHNGDLALLEQWIQENPHRIEEKSPKGKTLFHAASEGDQLDTLKWLYSQSPTCFKTFLKDTPFMSKLAAQSNPHTLDFLLSQGLDPQTTLSSQRTLLHIAARAGEVENVKVLLQRGAEIDALDQSQKTPLYYAGLRRHRSVIQVLIQNSARPDLPSGETVFDFIESQLILMDFMAYLPYHKAFWSWYALQAGQDHIDNYFFKREAANPEAYHSSQLLQVNSVSEQIKHLLNIGMIYLQQNNFITSALLFNTIMALFKMEQDQERGDLIGEGYLLYRIERIEELFVKSLGLIPKDPVINKTYQGRQLLQAGRIKYRTLLEKEGFSPALLKGLTMQFRSLLSALILDAQAILGPPPVTWVCMGLGSMSRDEMCPYSDLEFAFIIEKETPQALEYFRKLARLLQIKIINLGETKAEVLGPNHASPTPSGFCLDTGGNVPTRDELIGTPATLAQLQTSQSIRDDIILPNAMNSYCLVTGEVALIQQYQMKKEEIQKQIEKGSKIDNRKKLAFCLMENHLQEFSPNLSKEKEELRVFGIKKELYRPLQEILSSLAILYQLKSFNTFDRIDELVALKIFCPKGGDHLKKALSLVLALRLEAHFFYNNEIEYLYQSDNQEKDSTKLYLTPEKIETLQEIYRVLIPFCKATEEFYRTQDKNVFSSHEFYDQRSLVQGQALEKTFQYKEAQEACQRAVSLNPNDIEALFYLSRIEGELGDAQGQLKRAQQAFDLAKQKYGEKHPWVAQSLNNIGVALQRLGKLEKGLRYRKQALEILKAFYGETHPYVIASLDDFGFLFENLGKTEEGLIYYKQALGIRKALYGEKHPDVARSLKNIGFALEDLGKTEEGLIYYKHALKIQKALYGEKHPDVAVSLNNIGGVLLDLGKAEEGLIYYKHALEINKALHGEKHRDVATSLNNIGYALHGLGKTEEGLAYYKQALEIKKALYGEKHSAVATSLNNIGEAHNDLEKTEEGLTYLMQALEINKALYGEKHPDVATSLNNIGMTLNDLGKSEEGLIYLKQSLKIQKALHGEKHPALATSLNNIGTLLKSLGKTEEGLTYIKQAFKILKASKGDKHPDVATILNNIGMVLKDLGKIEEGLIYLKQALKIRKALYGETHPDVVISLNNINKVTSMWRKNE